MKKMFLILLISINLFAWEVNTHRAIDRTALTNTPNLSVFITDVSLENQNYVNETFDDYEMTYFKYIKDGEANGMSKLNQTFSDYNYQSLIEAGTMLEDAQWPHYSWVPGLVDQAHGRFWNHFYNVQGSCKSLKCDEIAIGKLPLPLFYRLIIAMENPTDAINWVYDRNKNKYDYVDAMEYFKKGFSETNGIERRKFQAKMLVSVGHIMHMMNDMNVPAHVRDDGHPNYEPLEIWMKGGNDHNQNTGFYINGNTLAGSIPVPTIDHMAPQTTFADYMKTEAYYTSMNFFSEDTIFTQTYPRKIDTYEESKWLSPTLEKVYIKHGLDQKKRAIRVKSYIINALNELIYRNEEVAPTSVFDGDFSVVQENGEILIPRAVANAAGFVNYFFRGRLEANVTPCGLSVKNNSDALLVASAETVTFSQGGVFNIYVELPEDQSVHLVASVPLDRDLAVGESFSFENINQELLTLLEPLGVSSSQSFPITVMFDGDIGSERGIAVIKTTMNPTETPEFQDGIITVDLLWQDASLDLDLTIDGPAPGAYENVDEACPTEHFYIATENEVQPGTYKIRVSPKGFYYDKAPQDVYVIIKVKGENKILHIPITDAATFDMGYIAKIEVTKDKVTTMTTTVHSSTSNGTTINSYTGSVSSSGSTVYRKLVYQIIPLLNQLMFGPVRSAHLELYSISDYAKELSPLFIGSTSSGSDLHTAGLIIFPYTLVTELADNELYLLRAEGGEDIDADDDGQLDATPRQNTGALHAVMNGKMLKDGAYKMNILTELVYQVTKDMFDVNTSEVIQERMDKVAPRLVAEDVNGDGVIDSTDLIKWMPTLDKEKLVFDYNTTFEPLVDKLFNGEDIFMDANKLLYYPVADAGSDFAIHANMPVTLNGSESYDINGKIVSYTWSEHGSAICQSSEPLCTVHGLSAGEHHINLTVTDEDQIERSDQVIVDVNNNAPVANAGEDVAINFRESLTLDGSGSYDSDGQIVKYTWQKGYTVLCQGVTPICVIDGLQAGSHTFSLVVQDDAGVSSVDYINVTVNNEAVLLGSINTSGILLNVKLSRDGTIAYLADNTSGLLVVDVSDPKTPRVTGQYNTPSFARNLVLSPDGTTLYIADTYSGLQIVDVNDPAKPFLLSSYDTDGYAYDITLSADGTMVYIADGSKGLKIIDVSNATTPHLVGNIKDFGRYGYAISVKLSADGMHAFVIDGEYGLQIIDISDPSLPYVIGTFRNGWMMDIMLSQNETVAYISSYPSFSIIDLSDVTSPSVLGSLNIGSFSGVLVNNNIVFASNGRSGVTFIDVSNSTAPKVLSTFDTSGSAINTTLSADGNTLFVADSDSGLQILDVSAFNH
ncbi:PKD domain-containing protein [Sulfurovum sp.]|uniref:LVIVD repeat-containing protein n=1 Tax=Sulfurovum sp. TaxID=1969726 RepID=UPI003565F1E1